MSNHAREVVLRRDHYIVLGALLTLMAVTWGYVVWVRGQMTIPSADMSAAIMPVSVLFIFVMWVVMMVGMMTPSAVPLLLLHARLARVAEFGRPLAATGWFAAGYLLAWMAFSLLASVAQVALTGAALLTPMMSIRSEFLGGVLLITAGAYQMSSLKYACFVRCQAPPLLTQHRFFT